MASSPPTVLILGHSFVRRLSSDLSSNFDARASEHFDHVGNAVIHLHSVGGRTVEKLRLYDLGVVSARRPDIIILEIGTNDLVNDRPEVVGSDIDDLVQLLLASYSVRVIGVCEVIPRVRAPFFNAAAPILNQYLNGVLGLRPNVFFPGVTAGVLVIPPLVLICATVFPLSQLSGSHLEGPSPSLIFFIPAVLRVHFMFVVGIRALVPAVHLFVSALRP